MAFNSATERDLALKKIVGKAHTSPDKEIANESLTSGLTISSQTVLSYLMTTRQILQTLKLEQHLL